MRMANLSPHVLQLALWDWLCACPVMHFFFPLSCSTEFNHASYFVTRSTSHTLIYINVFMIWISWSSCISLAFGKLSQGLSTLLWSHFSLIQNQVIMNQHNPFWEEAHIKFSFLIFLFVVISTSKCWLNCKHWVILDYKVLIIWPHFHR